MLAAKTYQRRPLSMTSLIDVIFLLLLFFMLTSTFSKFNELELSTGSGGAAQTPAQNIIFARLEADSLSINGVETSYEAAFQRVDELARGDDTKTLVLSVRAGANSQNLVDVIAGIKRIPSVNLSVVR